MDTIVRPHHLRAWRRTLRGCQLYDLVKRVSNFSRWRSRASEIRRSMSFLYGTPVACHSLGYMEMLVKPGMVLISLRKMPRLLDLAAFCVEAGSIRKSTRARPAQSQARKAAMAISRICFDSALVSFAGMMGMDGSRSVVLRLVVVELRVGDDLADDGGLGRVVAEDGDFELAGLDAGPADALLDDELAVEAGGEVDARSQFAAVVDLGDADRTAEVRGLDEERVCERLLDQSRAAFGVGAPFAAQRG